MLVALGSLAGAQAAPALVVGIADQKASTFADTRLTDLPVHHARLAVPWDALRYRWQRREIDAWMRAARTARMRPLVSFDRSRTRPFSLPAPAEYRVEVRRFMRRYRDVREYSPWNEPNFATRAVNNDPRKIADYYRALRSICPRCTVLGADLVDTSSLGRWLRAYLRVFAPGRRPKLWGLHNYVDANAGSSWGTRTMLRLAPGQIWFTETGGIVRRRPSARPRPGDRRSRIRSGRALAATAIRRVFHLAALSPRIRRVYVYHWKAGTNSDWDSALVAPNDRPRPSFAVFAERARRAAAAAAAAGG